MSSVAKQTNNTPANSAQCTTGQVPTCVDQPAWLNADDWIRHYEWEGANWPGLVCLAFETPPAAPPLPPTIIDQSFY